MLSRPMRPMRRHVPGEDDFSKPRMECKVAIADGRRSFGLHFDGGDEASDAADAVSTPEECAIRCRDKIETLKSMFGKRRTEDVQETKERDASTSSECDNGEIYGSESSGYETSDDDFVDKPSDDPRLSECDSEDSFVICFEKDPAEDEETLPLSDDTDDERSGSGSGSESDSDDDSTLEIVPELKSCMKKSGSGPSPKKKVSFASAKPEVHLIIAWKYAYQAARKGEWQNYSRDRERFKQRITNTSVSIDWVLNPRHRNKIFFQRFRPILMRWKREEREARRKAKQEAIEAKQSDEKLPETQISENLTNTMLDMKISASDKEPFLINTENQTLHEANDKLKA